MTKLAILELNELNFESLELYVRQGALPHFREFFARHGYCKTTSEVRYAELEPWIQWVTAHTGKTFAEHGIFRLGDAVHADVPQIWEQLESECGLKAGAISPMNAANRLSNAAFFVPDPWTPTHASGSWLLRQLAGAVAQAVNDNASSRITARSYFFLLLGLLRYARLENYPAYLGLVLGVLRRPWNKVRFLDLFLGDLFIHFSRAKKPDFCTLFINGAAHLQHHYMLNALGAAQRAGNPDWYVKPERDPVGDIYRTYDRILGSVVRALPDYRVMLMTGLHQESCPAPIFYWRLRDHDAFFRKLGCPFARVLPRMSRDFLIVFDSRADAECTSAILNAARINGAPAFQLEDRGNDIFVELVYSRDLDDTAELTSGPVTIAGLRGELVFVAIKNGVHSGVGYFSDSGRPAAALPATIPLAELHQGVLEVFRPPAVPKIA